MTAARRAASLFADNPSVWGRPWGSRLAARRADSLSPLMHASRGIPGHVSTIRDVIAGDVPRPVAAGPSAGPGGPRSPGRSGA
jgi:hypothetical protein